jgi:tripartite-type tricarboxylate transporter receptor subunit TctC
MAHLTNHLKTWVAGALSLAAGAAIAQGDYPSKPIRLVIPYAAGGLSDGVVRAVAEELDRTYKMKVIVDNRTGGNTVPAALAVTKAAPDGYTIGWFSASTFTTVPALTPNLPFKTSEFLPVFMAYRGPIVMAVANNVPATNAAEYITYGKKQPGRALVGATAKGGAGHLMAAALGKDAQMDVELVAYRGGPPMMLELMSGELPAAMDILDTFLQQHQAKKIRIIGHTGAKRLAILPDVPTFAEAGFANVKGQFWHGLFAPAGTPPQIVNLLNERFNAAMRAPAVTARLAPDLEVIPLKPAEFEAHIARDKAYWESIIKTTGVKLD